MTDALCGPSNALNSFQKHAQADRTLQQDRIVASRHAPGQGFRSFDPRAGSLDADFAAFENAPVHPFGQPLPPQQWQRPTGPALAPAPQAGPSWASDFQNLQISSPSPMLQTRGGHPQMQAPGGWQTEFMNQWQSPVALGKQRQFEPQAQGYLGGPQTSHLGNVTFVPWTALQENLRPESELPANVVAFDRAFEKAMAEMHQRGELDHWFPKEEPQQPIQQEQLIHEPAATKIGSDAIEYTETKDRSVDQDVRDSDDLARVAGELIMNVSHDTSEKFKNSQFLNLMRKIRDKELEVRDNELTSSQKDIDQTDIPDMTQDTQSTLQSTFQFPNMNEVYNTDQHLDMSVDDEFGYNPPRSQVSDLHPGGPYYPGQSPQPLSHATMSGAIGTQAPKSDDNSIYATA